MSKLIRNSRCAGIIVGVLVLQICLPTTVWADDFDPSGGAVVAISVVYLGVSVGGFWAAMRSSGKGRSGPIKTWLLAGGISFAYAFIATQKEEEEWSMSESSLAGLALALPVAGLSSLLHHAIVRKKDDKKELTGALFTIGKDTKSIRFPLLRYDMGTRTSKRLSQFGRNPRWSVKLLSIALSP